MHLGGFPFGRGGCLSGNPGGIGPEPEPTRAGSSGWLGNPPWTYETGGGIETGDSDLYTLGTVLHSTVPGQAIGVRYWRTGSETSYFNPGRSVGLYDDEGNLLASAGSIAADETGSGWRDVLFPSPVSLTPGADYVVAAMAQTYPAISGYFAGGGSGEGGYSAPDSTIVATGGRYVLNGGLAFPTTASTAAYCVDLIFQEDVPVASGTSLHVAKTGNDSTGDGSSGAPWLTIGKALDEAGRGDEIVVGDGTYNEGLTLANLRGVTIRAENPGMALLRAASGNGINGYNCGWVTVDGFDIQTMATNCHGVEIERSHHVTVKRCCSHDNPNSGISLPWGDHNLVEDCITYGNGRAGWYSGITFYQARNITGDDTSGPRNIIRRCISYDNWTTGGSTDGNGFLLDDWNHTQSYGPNPDAWQGVRYAYGGLVENCTAYGNGNKGIGIAWCENVLVRNNTVYSNGIDGSQGSWRGDLSNQSGKNCTFVNNIAVCDSSASGTGSSNTAIGNYGTSTADGFTCAGTVWHNNLTFDLNDPGDSSLNIDGGDAATPSSGDGNLLGIDPDFIDADGTIEVDLNGLVRTVKDLHVALGSSAIGAGTAAYGLPETDLVGNPRVIDGAVDIGALERPNINISGGTITTPEGFKVASFTSSGSLTVTGEGWLNYEIVGAGGGAGNVSTGSGGMRCPGGGAGEIKRGSVWLTAGTYSIVVGAGGGITGSQPGSDGGASSAFGVTAGGGGGGGGGGSSALSNGRPGGSGGGAAGWDGIAPGTGGASTAAAGGLGYAGGDGGGTVTADNRRGGGGGGAGGAGAAGVISTYDGGAGGAGVASTCPGVSATYAVGGNAYRGSAPSAPTAPGSGGHAGVGAGGAAKGTAGVAGIVNCWISTS